MAIEGILGSNRGTTVNEGRWRSDPRTDPHAQPHHPSFLNRYVTRAAMPTPRVAPCFFLGYGEASVEW